MLLTWLLLHIEENATNLHIVVHTAEVGAKLFNLDYEEFALKTSNNFFTLFNKATREINHG